MKRLFGNTSGLKANQIRRLEKIYRRRVPPEFVVTPELAKELAGLTVEIRRQIGILVNRAGKIVSVLIGDHQKIVIPDLSEYRTSPGRLKGLRCIHTHLNEEGLSRDDVTDLLLLRLDIMCVIMVSRHGTSRKVEIGHIFPGGKVEKPYQILPQRHLNQLDVGCLDLIKALEDELAHIRSLVRSSGKTERAYLVSVTTASMDLATRDMNELEDLAVSCGITVVGRMIQKRKSIDARFLMGRGKLEEISLMILIKGATLIIFDQELNPSQMRSITESTDIKIIDRTQLILDIFAQRAQSREGKLQVELAQLKYLLPHLVYKNTAMSRLTGGIGGRGPGETKLEINRRRVRDRIRRLEKSLSHVSKQRKQQKARRNKKGLPVISIIGYTNAGKSTLLNTLTRSKVLAEKRLFATLDPASRRLRFPRDIEVIITDTVGFIKDLPKDLMVAFKATLEELENADLLLHIIDVSNPRFKYQIQSVEKILRELELDHIPLLRVLNKIDLLEYGTRNNLAQRYNGVPVSAKSKKTLLPLIEKIQDEMIDMRPCMG